MGAQAVRARSCSAVLGSADLQRLDDRVQAGDLLTHIGNGSFGPGNSCDQIL